jgi:hypothetical protein
MARIDTKKYLEKNTTWSIYFLAQKAGTPPATVRILASPP